jgi:hypothetical protein
MNGMTQCTSIVHWQFTFLPDDVILIFLFSVRCNLRNAVEGFNFTESFLLRCLYAKEDGDHRAPEVGFLQGPLLLCVCFFPRIHLV